MELNRNQFFMIGVIVLLVGVQFRVVERYVLSQETTNFLAKQKAASDPEQSAKIDAAVSAGAIPKKEIRLPDWSGWALISVGSVLVLHSLALRKPG